MLQKVQPQNTVTCNTTKAICDAFLNIFFILA